MCLTLLLYLVLTYEYKYICAPIILSSLIFKEKTVAVIEAKAECIACMASLINIGKHKRTIRITNRGLRKEESHLNHDGHSKVT